MSKLFHLEMITPERRFFDGQVEAVQLPAPDGLMGILAGHEPSVISLDVGQVRLLYDGEWHECAASPGFVEIRSDGVVMHWVIRALSSLFSRAFRPRRHV